ncbi:MAG TPA: NUDIX domain-containing protein [Nocardioides sp.]|nr:NUDIX domain-containing protein [Nocardioides sp.]
MPIPPFVAELRSMVGNHPLWLPGVTAVVRRSGPTGDEILLTHRADDGEWAPVTGIVDPGEEPAVAAAREAMEETGVEVSVDRLAAVAVVPDVVYSNGDRSSYLDLTFACTWRGGEARVNDDESLDVRWWPVDALPSMTASTLARIEAALADETAARFTPPSS